MRVVSPTLRSLFRGYSASVRCRLHPFAPARCFPVCSHSAAYLAAFPPPARCGPGCSSFTSPFAPACSGLPVPVFFASRCAHSLRSVLVRFFASRYSPSLLSAPVHCFPVCSHSDAYLAAPCSLRSELLVPDCLSVSSTPTLAQIRSGRSVPVPVPVLACLLRSGQPMPAALLRSGLFSCVFSLRAALLRSCPPQSIVFPVCSHSATYLTAFLIVAVRTARSRLLIRLLYTHLSPNPVRAVRSRSCARLSPPLRFVLIHVFCFALFSSRLGSFRVACVRVFRLPHLSSTSVRAARARYSPLLRSMPAALLCFQRFPPIAICSTPFVSSGSPRLFRLFCFSLCSPLSPASVRTRSCSLLPAPLFHPGLFRAAHARRASPFRVARARCTPLLLAALLRSAHLHTLRPFATDPFITRQSASTGK